MRVVSVWVKSECTAQYDQSRTSSEWCSEDDDDDDDGNGGGDGGGGGGNGGDAS